MHRFGTHWLVAAALLWLPLLPAQAALAQYEEDPSPADSARDEAAEEVGDADGERQPEVATELEVRRLRERVVKLQREVAELRGDPREPSVPVRTLEVEFSASVLAGNISEAMLHSDVLFTLEHPDIYRLSLGTDYELRLRDEQTLQQRLDGLVEFSLLPNDPISPFALLDTGFDEMRRMSLRLDTGLGVRWTVLQDPADGLLFQQAPYASYTIALGLLLNHEQYQPAANFDHRTFVRLDVRVDVEQRVVRGLFVGNRFRLFTVLEDTENLLLRNESYLRFAIGEDIWVRALYVFREDTRPPPGVRRVDHEFKLAVALRLR